MESGTRVVVFTPTLHVEFYATTGFSLGRSGEKMENLEKRWTIWRKDGQSGEKMDDQRWWREKMEDLENRWTTDGEKRWTIWRKPHKKHAGPHKAKAFLTSITWCKPSGSKPHKEHAEPHKAQAFLTSLIWCKPSGSKTHKEHAEPVQRKGRLEVTPRENTQLNLSPTRTAYRLQQDHLDMILRISTGNGSGNCPSFLSISQQGTELSQPQP